jgi:hypothetical protein
VSGVSSLINALQNNGLITEDEADAILSAAAKAKNP